MMLNIKLFRKRMRLSSGQREKLDKVLESLLIAPERAYEQSVVPALKRYERILDRLEERGYDTEHYMERLRREKARNPG